MISIKRKADCCGCNACGDVCPKNAITFKIDIEGFWYPEISMEKCVNCHLCEKVCPNLNYEKQTNFNYKKPICYAAENKNIEVVFDSTSGGAFSAFAQRIYKDGGYVGGAIMDSNFNVKQVVSHNKEDLHALRRSKYQQSDASGFYKQVKTLVDNGNKVMVCGCPCQMVALRIFLQRDYDNLIIVDFICRGINTPKVGIKNREYLERLYGSKVVESRSKSKEYGWRAMTQKYVLADGRHIYYLAKDNPSSILYLSTGVTCRPSCYVCHFKGLPRFADITVADFWGIEKFEKHKDTDLGTSLIMINSEKGERFFETIKPRLNFVNATLDMALQQNSALLKPLANPVINRDCFYQDLDKLPFEKIIEKYVRPVELGHLFFLKHLFSALRRIKSIFFEYLFHPIQFIQFIKYNTIKGVWNNKYLHIHPYSVVEIQDGANLIVDSKLGVGGKRFNKSHLETRLLVEKGATLNVKGCFGIFYGSDVEVFSGGYLELGNHGGSNIDLNIICANKIVIGDDVMMGRHVTIRDNNGGHYISLQGYKNSRPIIIGNKVWIGEGSTIMPGVKIGDGAVISAGSMVLCNVPAHSLVAGNPARVVYENILWKY